MTTRNKYDPRSFLIRDSDIVERAIGVLRNAPLDAENPLEVLIREPVKVRKQDQNAAMWSGPLADIAAQAWLGGRQYSAEVWHEHFKREFLPEEYDPEQCKEGYVKWAIGVTGDRTLIGSTTQLTVKGFARYLTQVEAFGAGLGVKFHASPKDRRYGI